jgi:hypothetical protein
MSTQYRLVQSGKTANGGCSAGPRFVRAVAPQIGFGYCETVIVLVKHTLQTGAVLNYNDGEKERRLMDKMRKAYMG